MDEDRKKVFIDFTSDDMTEEEQYMAGCLANILEHIKRHEVLGLVVVGALTENRTLRRIVTNGDCPAERLLGVAEFSAHVIKMGMYACEMEVAHSHADGEDDATPGRFH